MKIDLFLKMLMEQLAWVLFTLQNWFPEHPFLQIPMELVSVFKKRKIIDVHDDARALNILSVLNDDWRALDLSKYWS